MSYALEKLYKNALDAPVTLKANQPPRKGKLCTGYKTTKDPAEKSYTLQMIDEKVTVYAVRTGTAIDTKEFKASNECPMLRTKPK